MTDHDGDAFDADATHLKWMRVAMAMVRTNNRAEVS